MIKTPYSVGIVVDPSFGPQLRALLTRLPVWIVDTDVNRRAAERIWAESPDHDHARVGGLTAFRADASATPEEVCARILSTVASDGRSSGSTLR